MGQLCTYVPADNLASLFADSGSCCTTLPEHIDFGELEEWSEFNFSVARE